MTLIRKLAGLRHLWLLPRAALMGMVRGYRLFFSAWLGASCRFEPSCSRYALQALDEHGAIHGSYLTLRRLCRCNSWCDGGLDPVPAPPPHHLFQRFERLATAKPCTRTSEK